MPRRKQAASDEFTDDEQSAAARATSRRRYKSKVTLPQNVLDEIDREAEREAQAWYDDMMPKLQRFHDAADVASRDEEEDS